MRAPVVFYDRANEAAAQLRAWRLRLAVDLRAGRALVPLRRALRGPVGVDAATLLLEAMQEARRQGAVVSYDLNYREKLWRSRGGPEQAQAVTRRRLVEHVDVLVGNEEDMQLSLGIEGPEAARASSLDPRPSWPASSRSCSAIPRIRVIATTPARGPLGDPPSLERRRLGGGQVHQAPTIDLDIVDRVGGGDGFASGLFYGLLVGPPDRRGPPPGLGARRAPHDLPGRHDDGQPRPGAGRWRPEGRRGSSADRGSRAAEGPRLLA